MEVERRSGGGSRQRRSSVRKSLRLIGSRWLSVVAAGVGAGDRGERAKRKERIVPLGEDGRDTSELEEDEETESRRMVPTVVLKWADEEESQEESASSTAEINGSVEESSFWGTWEKNKSGEFLAEDEVGDQFIWDYEFEDLCLSSGCPSPETGRLSGIPSSDGGRKSPMGSNQEVCPSSQVLSGSPCSSSLPTPSPPSSGSSAVFTAISTLRRNSFATSASITRKQLDSA